MIRNCSQLLSVFVFADLSTLYGRLVEIERVQAGFQRQLETIECRVDALSANQGVPDCMLNSAEKRVAITSTISSTGQTTSTIREELAPPSPTNASVPISAPTTKAIPTQISTPVTEAISEQVTEAITTSESETRVAPVTAVYMSNSTEHAAPPLVYNIGLRKGDSTPPLVKHEKDEPVSAEKTCDLMATKKKQASNDK